VRGGLARFLELGVGCGGSSAMMSAIRSGTVVDDVLGEICDVSRPYAASWSNRGDVPMRDCGLWDVDPPSRLTTPRRVEGAAAGSPNIRHRLRRIWSTPAMSSPHWPRAVWTRRGSGIAADHRRRDAPGRGVQTDEPDRHRATADRSSSPSATTRRSSGTSGRCSPAKKLWCQLFSEPGRGGRISRNLSTRRRARR